jgi:hypothetical protein
MCNINQLRSRRFRDGWLLIWLGLLTAVIACHHDGAQPAPNAPAMTLDRIAIVGASVSAGFGGLGFGDAFAAATKAPVESEANVMLFRDPVGETKLQLGKATAFHPTAVIAVDLLFWDVYGSRDPAWRTQALDSAFAELDKLRAAGVWIVIGDVPLITTAAEWMLPKEAVPDPAALAAINARIGDWSKRDRVLLVPLAAWSEPLRSNATVKLPTGEDVEASTLMAADGLHANPLGTWYLLDKLDHLIEERYPGTAKQALVFSRPK